MGYVVVVLAQTVVLPIVFGIATLRSHETAVVVATFGRWFLFWGIGTRLALAGLVQVVKPNFTTQEILGDAPQKGANLVTRELGFANLAIGTGSIVGTFAGGGVAAAVTGGLYMGVAGVMHLGKRDMNLKEHVATWTDLLMAAAMAAYVVAASSYGARVLARRLADVAAEGGAERARRSVADALGDLGHREILAAEQILRHGHPPRE